MRVLLLHPEDSIDGGPWSHERWDLIVDLGFAGHDAYDEWSRRASTRIVSIHHYGREIDSYRWVNRVFEQGRRRLIDRSGLDWWDILAMEKYQDVHTLYQFRQLQQEIGDDSTELAATRPHLSARIGEQVFAGPLRLFERGKTGILQKAGRAIKSAQNLRAAQISEIALDKWDASYRLRRRWAKRHRARTEEACVLLPSAYSNVTRSVLAYARQLPSHKFLLVTTRKNANPAFVPANVSLTSLAAYVQPEEVTRQERNELQEQWQAFSRQMRQESAELRAAAGAGVWDYFPAHLDHGLHLREAWRTVLQSAPLTAVLCGDDLNYHTRLPLILAQRGGLNSIYCSHGALDVGFFFKTPYADFFLVKGAMERDYLRKAVPLADEQIVVGAPGPNHIRAQKLAGRDTVIFFSQPYEVIGGRAEAIYREVVPRLHSMASASGRRLIIKLHPFESKRMREKLVNSVLPERPPESIEIIGGVSAETLMAQAWCGVTVDSSVAVECALKGIPFFLCGWLDFTGVGYLHQFAKFGVAKVLNAPDEIEHIPEMVRDQQFDPALLERLWHAADPEQLEEVMFGAKQRHLNPCAS
jgi:hypothetical protein